MMKEDTSFINDPLGLNRVYLKENINSQFNFVRVDLAIFCIKAWIIPVLAGALIKGPAIFQL